VRRVDVLDLEGDPAAGRALGDQLADLLGGLRVVRRRAGPFEEDLPVVAGDPVSQRMKPRSASVPTSRPSTPT